MLEEAAAEDAVGAFIEGLPVADDIAAVVGFVGHHDDRGITGHGVEALGDRSPEAVRSGILDRAEDGDFGSFALEDLPSGVGRTVVDHNDFRGERLGAKAPSAGARRWRGCSPPHPARG